MPNTQLQKDILILHLLTTTTDSDQNYGTHNIAIMYKLKREGIAGHSE